MSVLSYQEIRSRCIFDKLITPWEERTRFAGMTYGLGPAGYDIRLDQPLLMSSGAFALASSLEQFNMQTDIVAQVCDKSTLARMGLFVQNTIIEPGWRGFLTLELTYHGIGQIQLPAGAPIAQILFQFLSTPTAKPYEGKYQDQQRGAQAAREDDDR